MKNLFLLFTLSLFQFSLLAQDLPCTGFESGNEGWTTYNATNLGISSPSLDGTNYLTIKDASGPSFIMNNTSYNGSWEKYNDKCICYDYKALNDGYSNSVANINAMLYLYQGANPHTATLRARFIPYNQVTENDPWTRFCAPIEFISGTTLPSNSYGQWVMLTGSPSDWNTLLSSVSGLAFAIDLAGSSLQTEILGIDNICIEDCPSDATPINSIYCCEGESIMKNGNFEDGDIGFTSDYSSNANPYPGQYTVTDPATALGISPNWVVDDHSNCNSGSGSNVLFVNGKTTQAAGTFSTIYEQTISGLDTDSTYKFCGFFKNLPQCTFDVTPKIRIEITDASSPYFPWTDISTDDSDLCDWQEEGVKFTPNSSSVTVKILLLEDGIGDGNDLAIDDLGLLLMPSPNLEITVENQSLNPTTSRITASINALTSADDVFPDAGCDHFWIVAEAGGIGGPFTNLAWGDATAGWGTTTTFPGYNGGSADGNFNTNQLYVVALFINNCDCSADDYTLQYTFDMARLAQDGVLDNAQLSKESSDMLLNYMKNNDHNLKSSDTDIHSSGIKVSPNPSNGKFLLELDQIDAGAEITILDNNGRTISQMTSKRTSTELDLSDYANGVYFLQVRQGKEIHTKRLMKVE